jgi:mitochondrial chaperone BCS1
MPYRHSFAQVIYVMEDIDAASQIVLSREHKKPEQEVDDSPMLGPLLEDGSSGAGGDDAALLLGLLASMADTGVATGTGTGTGTSMEGFGMDSDGWITVGGGGKDFKKANGNDKLDLAGLLNVLDGVVDTPGRLLVLTTNHPEKIDPALIRPGRVDKMIYLGYILPTQAMKVSPSPSAVLCGHSSSAVSLSLCLSVSLSIR